MKLYYAHVPGGNFGDDLNPYLWPKLFPKPIEEYYDNETLFVGIGTILKPRIPNKPVKLIFGSGFGYDHPPKINEDWKFYCVRGPLTANALKLDPSLAICDSAILVRELIKPAKKSKYSAAFMPHHNTPKEDDWQSVCDSISVQYIDPTAPVIDTLDIILHSDVVITEAMHGAIIADAFRIPWIPVRTRPGLYQFKWQDWSMSLGLEHEFEWLTPIWDKGIPRTGRIPTPIKEGYSYFLAHRVAAERLKWLVKFGRRRLSSDINFQTVYQRLLEKFQILTEELG